MVFEMVRKARRWRVSRLFGGGVVGRDAVENARGGDCGEDIAEQAFLGFKMWYGQFD